MEKITQEKNEALNTIQQLKQTIKKLNEQISISTSEKNNLISKLNSAEYNTKKNTKVEQYYENHIKSLNEQIYQLESQIDSLQNKVKQNKVKQLSRNYQKSNEYDSNINILKEQINYLQNENQKLTQIINNDLTKRQNHNNRIERQKAQSNRTRLTESENEYMNKFIKDFHTQVDELNYNNDNYEMSENYYSNYNINRNNNDMNAINKYNYEEADDEVNQEEENYNSNNSNNSNDIIYKMDNYYQRSNNDIQQTNLNYKDNEDIKINISNININEDKDKEIDFNK